MKRRRTCESNLSKERSFFRTIMFRFCRSGETYGNKTRLAPRMTRVSEVLEKIGSPAASMISS